MPDQVSQSVRSPDELRPGEYAKLPVTYRGRTFDAWWYVSPNGLGPARLSMPEDVELGAVQGCHHVEEHEDGTISVLPQPGNSNSILVEGWNGKYGDERAMVSWHGYIRRGEWEGDDA